MGHYFLGHRVERVWTLILNRAITKRTFDFLISIFLRIRKDKVVFRSEIFTFYFCVGLGMRGMSSIVRFRAELDRLILDLDNERGIRTAPILSKQNNTISHLFPCSRTIVEAQPPL